MKMTLRSRLMTGILVSVTALFVLTGLSISLMKQIDDGLEALYVDRIEPLAQLKTVVDRYAVSVIDAANKVHIGQFSPQQARTELSQARQEIDAIWRVYMSTQLTAEEAELAAQARRLFGPANAMIERLDRQLASLGASGEGQLQASIVELYQVIDPISGVFGDLVDLQLREASVKRDAVHASTTAMTWWFSLFSLLVTIVVIALGMRTYRAITQPLNQMQQVIEEIEASKNLLLRVPVLRQDELGVIATDVNRLLVVFHHLIQELNSAIDQIVAASEEMSAISTQSSEGMQRQQQEIEVVAAAMNQMTSTVHEVSQHALSAAQGAESADEQAQDGQDIVQQTRQRIEQLAQIFSQSSQTVEQVSHESQQIGSVIDVIRGIAEQTNLLALNAAIEAARAGEQGRGFAVVADEVRSLASRTQSSTTDIQSMIEKLQRRVEEVVKAIQQGQSVVKTSVEHAEQAGGALTKITASVATVNDMNMQIASAAEEQSSVAEEINQRVLAISDVSREAAEAANHSAAASEELARLAAGLQSLSSQFKVS